MTRASNDVTPPPPEGILAAKTEPRIGTVIAGTYCVTRHLGSGGSGHVFEARHVRLGNYFAIKLLRSEMCTGKRTSQRFRREAQAMARVNNQHVVSIIDCGELDDGTPYLVMELLEGEDLRSLLSRQGQLPLRRATQLVVEACRGLASIHAAGLVHRDLKPENLFIARRAGGEDWCKILDFGVAKMESTFVTAQGAIVGTVRYMAPEQLTSAAAAGATSDVYSLGAILYECLSGKPLYEGETVQAIMYQVINAEPEPLSLACPSLPPQLVEVASRSLSKNPAQRQHGAEQLAQEILAAIDEALVGAGNVTVSEEAPRPGSTLDGPPTSGPKRISALSPRYAAALGCGAGLTLGWLVFANFQAPASQAGLAPTSADIPAVRGPKLSPPPPVTTAAAQSPSQQPTSVASPSATVAAASSAPRAARLAPSAPPKVRPTSSVVPHDNTPVGNLVVANPYGD